jgi:hypothetical protein
MEVNKEKIILFYITRMQEKTIKIANKLLKNLATLNISKGRQGNGKIVPGTN